MKILVVHTGGTIASVVNDGEINVSEASVSLLAANYKENIKTDVEFSEHFAMNILSENMNTDRWNFLISYLKGLSLKEYSGIIITHGSDTLAFTAALFGMIFADISVPMIFVAANLPLDNKKTNGFINFNSAVDFISEQLRGVFVIYANSRSINVYLSTQMFSADCFSDDFSAPHGKPFAYSINGKTVYNFIELASKIKDYKNKFDLKNITLKPCVSIITVYPGIRISVSSLPQGTKAVLLLLYHSATAPVEDEVLIRFLSDCAKADILVYGCSFKRIKEKYYSANVLINNGLKPLYNITMESAYAKLLLAYSQNNYLIEEIVSENLFFESAQ